MSRLRPLVKQWFVGMLAATGMVWAAAYSLFLYNRVSFGAPSSHLLFSRDLNRLELGALSPLALSALIGGILPSPIVDPLKKALTINPGGA